MNYELSLKLHDSPNSDDALDATRLDEVLALFVTGEDAQKMEACLRRQPADAPAPNEEVKEIVPSQDVHPHSGDDWTPGQKLTLSSLMAPLATDDRPITAHRQATPAGLPQCIDVSISFELRDEAAFEKAFLHTMHFASLIGAKVIDPQVSGEITEKSLSSAREKWLQMRSWLLRTDGRSALLAPPDAPLTLPEPTFFERHAKAIIIVVLGLVLIGIIQRLVQFLSLAWS